jgi:ankyrin repeat protein
VIGLTAEWVSKVSGIRMWAASNKRTEVARLLIDEGADINAQGDEKKTALMRAIESGDTGIAKLLIEKGADLDIADASQLTPLLYAAREGDLEVAELLIEHGIVPSPPSILTAVVNSRTEIARLLIDKGADVNVATPDGDTALHHAVAKKNAEMVGLLIESGANLNVKDRFGNTPLRRARVVTRDKAVTELLKQAGAK